MECRHFSAEQVDSTTSPKLGFVGRLIQNYTILYFMKIVQFQRLGDPNGLKESPKSAIFGP
jgi:hypothetical protein